MDSTIKHDKENQKFFAIKNKEESALKYDKIDEQTLEYYSTFVPEDLRKQGIASQITEFALQYASDNNYQIVASCPFVKRYIVNHPNYQKLLKKKAETKSNNSKFSIKKYWPLISLIIISCLAAFALNCHIEGGMRTWMHYFMGIFLLIFSTLKIFNPVDFADGFEMYDIIAKRSRIYAYCYPLIELLLSLAFLAFLLPILTYLITIAILSIGAIGVVKALKTGLDINCPCMGTILNVPLSTVTLTEDIGMVLMALILLIMALITAL